MLALALCLLLTACSREEDKLLGTWKAVPDGAGILTSGASPMTTDMIIFDNGLMLMSENGGEDWYRLNWGAEDGKIALLYTFLTYSDVYGNWFYDTGGNVLLEYELKGDSLVMGYNLGAAGEVLEYEFTRQ